MTSGPNRCRATNQINIYKWGATVTAYGGRWISQDGSNNEPPEWICWLLAPGRGLPPYNWAQDLRQVIRSKSERLWANKASLRATKATQSNWIHIALVTNLQIKSLLFLSSMPSISTYRLLSRLIIGRNCRIHPKPSTFMKPWTIFFKQSEPNGVPRESSEGSLIRTKIHPEQNTSKL